MAKARMIDTKFWSDGFIVSLKPIERYLFLYFLTNEHTAICGIYELSMPVMVRETGLRTGQLLDILQRFVGRIYYIEGWIYIKNFVKNQSGVSETIKKGIKNSRDLVPKEILKTIMDIENGKGIDTLYIVPVLSESELKSESLSESKPKSKLNSSPPAEFKEKYLSRFKTPNSKVHSSKDLLATEIYEWAAGNLKYPVIRRMVNLKGEQFCREAWAEVKQENAKEPWKLWMWKLGQVKIKTTEKV